MKDAPRSIASLAALAGVAFAAAACGQATPAPDVPKVEASAAPVAALEPPAIVVPPRLCSGRSRIGSLVSQGPLPQAPTSIAADTAVAEANTKSGSWMEDAFKTVGPATVVILDNHNSMGTGVIVDPSGLVLTNFHVVRGGRQKDFGFEVTVKLGKLAQGKMEMVDKGYKGIVYRADPVRDMALVKIIDPPANLPSIAVSAKDPGIGQPVLKVGNMGIGFLWSAKSCQITNFGELGKDISRLQGIDCSQHEPTAAPLEVKAMQVSCEKVKEQMKDEMSSLNGGLMVQTDCQLSPGDSGGPLVNMEGQIVGLNDIGTKEATASFHIHAAEIRDFVKNLPTKPAQLPPDPWCDGGLESSLEDADLDGKIDVLHTQGYAHGAEAYFLDLDQDQFTRSPEAAASLPAFDAEVVLLTGPDGTFVWYDTNNDGKYDVLLEDDHGSGKANTAFRIEADGTMKEDKTLAGTNDLDAKLLPKLDAAALSRFAHIGTLINADFTSDDMRSAERAPKMPDPIWGGGRKGSIVDTDGDGKGDTILEAGLFSRGVLIDSDERVLGAFKPGDEPQQLINDRKVGADISIVRQGRTVWASYDTDGDGQFDLALFSKLGDGFNLADEAYRIVNGKPVPAPENLGRMLLRPGLVKKQRAYALVSAVPFSKATDESLGSFPDPRTSSYSFRFRKEAGFGKAVAESTDSTTQTVLVDGAGDSHLTGNMDASTAVRGGAFKANMAYVSNGGREWFYYDTDKDGKFDLVLFTAHPINKSAERAFRIGDGGVTVDTSLANARLVLYKTVFKDPKVGPKFKKIAEKIFNKLAIEE